MHWMHSWSLCPLMRWCALVSVHNQSMGQFVKPNCYLSLPRFTQELLNSDQYITKSLCTMQILVLLWSHVIIEVALQQAINSGYLFISWLSLQQQHLGSSCTWRSTKRNHKRKGTSSIEVAHCQVSIQWFPLPSWTRTLKSHNLFCPFQLPILLSISTTDISSRCARLQVLEDNTVELSELLAAIVTHGLF